MVSEIAIWVFWIGLFIFVVFFVKNHYDEIEEQERLDLEVVLDKEASKHRKD